jgi:CDP-glucose 4,6-dehydratase
MGSKQSSLEGLVMKTQFWKNKKVLVTGHTGFKGVWLSLWLHHMGAHVVGVSLDPPTIPNLYNQTNIADCILSLREDIRNLDAMKEIFQKHQPEIVFHLAAQSLVQYSYREPVETYQTNVMGTLNILEGIRCTNSVRAAVIVTTDKCYDNREWEWGYREYEPMGGHDPYSSSKGCAELLFASYHKSYFAPETFDQHKTAIASVRAGNVIGGGDWAEDRLIPDIIRAIYKSDIIQIRNPRAIRPWQHVLEPLAGYLGLAEQLHDNGPKYSGSWNFGPLEIDAKSVQWIVEKVTDQWGGDTKWSVDENQHPYEANYLKLDCSKAHNQLSWWPKWTLNDAITKIVYWYQAELGGEDMQIVSLNQINEYMHTNNLYQ